MKSNHYSRLLLPALVGLLSLSPTPPQIYKAGMSSGAGGSQDDFIDLYTGIKTTGSYNFSGNEADYSNTTGGFDIFMGFRQSTPTKPAQITTL
jgi:hypothetical protein